MTYVVLAKGFFVFIIAPGLNCSYSLAVDKALFTRCRNNSWLTYRYQKNILAYRMTKIYLFIFSPYTTYTKSSLYTIVLLHLKDSQTYSQQICESSDLLGGWRSPVTNVPQQPPHAKETKARKSRAVPQLLLYPYARGFPGDHFYTLRVKDERDLDWLCEKF